MAEITYHQVIELVKTIPADRLASLYDFARFLKVKSLPSDDYVDIFGESRDEIEADEAWWTEQFDHSETTLLRLAKEAANEYQAGDADLIEFDENGRMRR